MMPFKEVTFRVACIKKTLKNKKAVKTYTKKPVRFSLIHGEAFYLRR